MPLSNEMLAWLEQNGTETEIDIAAGYINRWIGSEDGDHAKTVTPERVEELEAWSKKCTDSV